MKALMLVLFVQMMIVIGLVLTAMFLQAHDESVTADERVRAAERRARFAPRRAARAMKKRGLLPPDFRRRRIAAVHARMTATG